MTTGHTMKEPPFLTAVYTDGGGGGVAGMRDGNMQEPGC